MGTRALNRALLARQMLLTRAPYSTLEVISHLVGLQAQSPNAPYFALWSRIQGFQQEDLSSLIRERKIIRIALMRSTIHLVSAQDGLSLRPWVQSAHERGLKGAYGKLLGDVRLDDIAASGRALVEASPLTFNEMGKCLQQQWPDRDPGALAAVVRTRVPLVQLPPRGLWGESGQAIHTSIEAWLNLPLTSHPEPEEFILRYLAAFGPATIKDIQVWSGLTRLNTYVERLLPQLIRFRNEQGTVLYDLPDAPRPDPDTPAPLRFLGEYDNILLSYADRNRILDDSFRKRVFTSNGIIRSTLLLDGFVGTWRIERERNAATLTIQPFIQLRDEDRHGIAEEGMQLLQFAAAHDATHTVKFLPIEE
ncbi:winged helix DNA-binding domain-containing protein [Paenibacillus selenitireducens]|nr:winged helix DNA-binding domain-containing protein [Paenibacillus selenitireducens]